MARQCRSAPAIKLLEDKMNADADINGVGVQMILLVEDSVRFYSSVLPIVYKFILKQSREFSTEALNEHEQMLRMRGRPKVMLARDYEEAITLYERYSNHILGVISDVSFMREGKKAPKAGIRLAKELRSRDPYLPMIIESSENENAHDVIELGGTFIDKNSKISRRPRQGHHQQLRLRRLRDPQSRNRRRDLPHQIAERPAEKHLQHPRRGPLLACLVQRHLALALLRAMFPIAEVIKHHRFRDLKRCPQVRQLFFDLIVKYRKMKNRGVVAIFQKDRFDHYSNFARIGQGSLGGKGRGLAFIDSIKKNPDLRQFRRHINNHSAHRCALHRHFDELIGVEPPLPHSPQRCALRQKKFSATSSKASFAQNQRRSSRTLRGGRHPR